MSSSSSHSGLWVVFVIVILIVAIIEVVGMWKVMEKAGRPGWAAIIPVYNYWVLFEISGKPGWWALASLLGVIPVLGVFAGIVMLVLEIIAFMELARRFGKSQVFGVVGLAIFGFIGFPMLGYGDAKYQGGHTAAAGGTTPAASTPPAETK